MARRPGIPLVLVGITGVSRLGTKALQPDAPSCGTAGVCGGLAAPRRRFESAWSPERSRTETAVKGGDDSRMSDPVKTKTKSEETRERILRAALEMFHDRGFESTTMREIAGRAEVATGAAYYYFASKDAIVLAFYDQARKDMEPLLERALTETRDLRERLSKIIRVKLDYFSSSRNLLSALSGHTNPQHPLSPFSEQTREIREQDIAF